MELPLTSVSLAMVPPNTSMETEHCSILCMQVIVGAANLPILDTETVSVRSLNVTEPISADTGFDALAKGSATG
jgi:hypothetical protein